MRQIPLTQGYIALVDDEDHERLAKYNWSAKWSAGNLYAARGRMPTIRMHHEILPEKPGFEIDHRNGNGLDNQRHNLRYATHSQNLANSRPRRSVSGYRGVYLQHGRWRATISKGNGTKRHLGYFTTREEAALAYNLAAAAHFGEFARLNVVP